MGLSGAISYRGQWAYELPNNKLNHTSGIEFHDANGVEEFPSSSI